MFRWVMLGAGNIANTFARTVREMDGHEVAAVASKSQARAEKLALTHGIPRFFDDYEEMLESVPADAAYISVTVNDHARLTQMCVRHGIPVLCEKAMFRSFDEARKTFDLAAERHVFTMEGTWSLFLPANLTARRWLEDGRIGSCQDMQVSIGFQPEMDPSSRYFSRTLGGGCARDITVYAYELSRFFLGGPMEEMEVEAWGCETGVDIENRIRMNLGGIRVLLHTSFRAPDMEEQLVITGEKGSIQIPHPHYASRAFLRSPEGKVLDTFDDPASASFRWEILEVERNVRGGKLESPVVPHGLTLSCAGLFDLIEEKLRSEG
ncbi:MAG: Gfo/Idh/MocA family oxidoreductase [Clostridia bacterium]|nr:Gfo/Idh/MocA family oxidoreductase [Clostridia bacterium]